MYGITSNASRDAQTVGPLEVVTTDQAGNLAGDGGAIFHRLDNLEGRDKELAEGIAISAALQNPDLTGAETFGVAGVVGHNFLEQGDRVAISGGVGVGTREGTVAGRVGVQWTR
jgi:hypothetical protein